MKMKKMVQWIIGIFVVTIVCGIVPGATSENQPQPAPPIEISGLSPERDVSDTNGLISGLSTIFIYKFIRHLDQMPVQDPTSTTEKRGKPIPYLNHHFGPEDMIYDSGVNRGICIQMDGFIKFSEPGKYGMMALSNDGIRVELCKQTILTDPNVHSDRFSPQAVLDIPRSGWYPVMIQYFQRKGTAAIELQWRPPGKSEFAVIPAEAYSHKPISTVSP